MAVPNDIAHWRAQIFARLLQAVFVLGLATAIPSVLQVISAGLWQIALVDGVALRWLTGILLLRRIPYTVRVVNFLALTYMVGVALMLKVGPVSQIYLMAIPVLATLLLDLQAAAQLHFDGIPDYAFLKAAIVTINFLFIALVLTLFRAVLLQHPARSLDELRATADSLEMGLKELSALNNELRLTSAVMVCLNDMVLIAEVANGQQHIIFVNEACERRTGYRRHEVLGRPLFLLQGPDTDAAALQRIEQAMARSEAVHAELLNYTKSGEPFCGESDLVPFTDDSGNNTHWVAVERDITERKKSQDDIHRLAFFDVLTGLPNRRLLMDRIDKLLASSERGATFSAVMFVDLDRFKYINAARGHTIGDALLCSTAQRLSRLMRKVDMVARIGGDEFVVLLAHLSTDLPSASHAALTVAEKVRDTIGTLASSGVSPRLPVQEVTEGLLIDKLDNTSARTQQLAALGIRFSIDDFGTGYSSLAYLKKMPPYELKIDRSFVMDTPDDANSRALAQSILAMASHQGLRVVAEGVETQTQAVAHQCAGRQGFLFARPMPLPALLDFVRGEAAHAA